MEIQVKPRQDRKNFVSNTATTRQHREEFDGEMKTLPIKRVPIEFLLYRVNNMRTTVEQLEYIESNGLPKDFFRANQESDLTQGAQHRILVEMSKSNIANIWEALRTRRSLRDPLVITQDCVVVNGNRRLAAMRDLFSSSPQDFDSFRTVECVVLPEVDESTLVDYETRIQIARDLRSEYGWVHTALGLQTQINELNWTEDRAVQAWGKEWKELAALLQSFALATEYLNFVDKNGDFGHLKDKEQVFKTLTETQEKERAQGTNEATLRAQRYLVYQVLRTEDFEGRAFDYARMSPEILKKIEPALRSDFALAPSMDTPVESDIDDPLADSPEVANEAHGEQLLNALKNVSNSNAIRDLAESGKNQIAFEKNAKKRGALLLNNARSAFNLLNAVTSIEQVDTDSMPNAFSILLDSIKEIERLTTLILARKPDVLESVDMGRIATAELRAQELLNKLQARLQ